MTSRPKSERNTQRCSGAEPGGAGDAPYNKTEIKTFKDDFTQKIYHRQSSRKIPPEFQQVALRKLRMLNNAISINRKAPIPVGATVLIGATLAVVLLVRRAGSGGI